MLAQSCLQELHHSWLPHVTESGLDRIIDLLEKGSPLLIHGSFTRAMPQGCLATQIAWHHPRTEHLNHDAGIIWLSQVVGINPATSRVIRNWDASTRCDWQMRADLLEVLKEYRRGRQQCPAQPEETLTPVTV
jgi:hypothetical protein